MYRTMQNQRGSMPCECSNPAILATSLLSSLSTLVRLETGLPALQMMKQGQRSSGNLSMHLVAMILTNLTWPQAFAMTGKCMLIKLQNSLQFWQRWRSTNDSGSASVTSLMYSSREISITCPYFSLTDLILSCCMRLAIYWRVNSSSKSRSSSSSLIFSTDILSNLFSNLLSSSCFSCMSFCSSASVVFFSLGKQLPYLTCRSNHSVDTPFAINSYSIQQLIRNNLELIIQSKGSSSTGFYKTQQGTHFQKSLNFLIVKDKMRVQIGSERSELIFY